MSHATPLLFSQNTARAIDKTALFDDIGDEGWELVNVFDTNMLHGRTRAEVEQQAVQLRELLGSACRGHDILYSTAILKKTGLRLRQSQES